MDFEHKRFNMFCSLNVCHVVLCLVIIIRSRYYYPIIIIIKPYSGYKMQQRNTKYKLSYTQ